MEDPSYLFVSFSQEQNVSVQFFSCLIGEGGRRSPKATHVLIAGKLSGKISLLCFCQVGE